MLNFINVLKSRKSTLSTTYWKQRVRQTKIPNEIYKLLFTLFLKNIQKMIAIENDDKSFNIEDCLQLSKRIKVPIILDYHHHQCNPSKTPLEKLLSQILATWK